MDQASLASIHESKTLAGIFQHIVDDCRVMKNDKIGMVILLNFGNNDDDDDDDPISVRHSHQQNISSPARARGMAGRIPKALQGCAHLPAYRTAACDKADAGASRSCR